MLAQAGSLDLILLSGLRDMGGTHVVHCTRIKVPEPPFKWSQTHAQQIFPYYLLHAGHCAKEHFHAVWGNLWTLLWTLSWLKHAFAMQRDRASSLTVM